MYLTEDLTKYKTNIIRLINLGVQHCLSLICFTVAIVEYLLITRYSMCNVPVSEIKDINIHKIAMLV